MNCPLCGSKVLYEGLNNIECAGALIEKDTNWAPCANYKPYKDSADDNGWMERFKQELRGLSWLSEAQVVSMHISLDTWQIFPYDYQIGMHEGRVLKLQHVEENHS